MQYDIDNLQIQITNKRNKFYNKCNCSFSISTTPGHISVSHFIEMFLASKPQ